MPPTSRRRLEAFQGPLIKPLIAPAAWNFSLAARARGLGTAWTSVHLFFEEEAAQILGIPYAEVTQACLIPLAYTRGTK